MSWINALDKLFKAKSFHDTMKEVKKLHDYSKKLNKKDPKKSYRDTLKYFGNDKIDRVTASFRKAEDAADAVLSAKMQWPRSGTAPSFSFAKKFALKHGHDSKQAKAAIRRNQKALDSYQKKLWWEILKLMAAHLQMPKMIAQAKAVAAYATVLQKAFLAAAKVPNITSAVNAEFWQWSQDSLYLSGVAGRVHSKFQKIERRNKTLIKEGKLLIATNKLWIIWAKNDATRSADSLKKNQKAAKPKR